ncbi:MAG: GNAT family N-acetyltransferase [Actinomycetota bacterium]|nr:GNAT family N-acetyltransferase [Actinomycetota bacterium]
MPDLRVRDLRPDDFDDVVQIRVRSFGPMSGSDRAQWRRSAEVAAAGGRLLGAVRGDRLVAAARIWEFGQWWRGRPVPMGGIGGVVVDPEHRGRGVATLLMRALLGRCRDLGLVLSGLYPASLPVYRRVGYELAGARYRYTFRSDDLRALGPVEARLRRTSAADAERLLELVARVRSTRAESGPIVWPVEEVRHWLDESDTFGYLAEDGFVVYAWSGRDLEVHELVAVSPETARGLWTLVGSGASVAEHVHAYVAPHDPIHLRVPREARHEVTVQRWMLRLVDAPAAVAARGWPGGVDVDVGLVIDDVEQTANSGAWRLQVRGGTATLTPTSPDDGSLGVGPRGLAALYAGTPVATLRTSGLAAGGCPEGDAGLDTAFAGPTPFMLDYF